ncbi:IclR family transcriptional regulator [Rhodopseudomonas sp.]|uniref:IclR family transcriptional regulator n=1 Tax=Rhodopseudomonas sp. TaxID=1078 RepID=UPI003B3AB6D3
MGRKKLAGRASERKEDASTAAGGRVEFNRAAARALDILTAFNGGDQFLGNVEIAERTSIPKATVSRITATLTELGYLNFDRQIGKYEIGPRVLALSFPLMSKLRVQTHARQRMDQLAREANAVVGLAILDDLNVVFIDTAVGDHQHFREAQVGYRVPVALTAMGWACLSTMNGMRRAEIMERLATAYPGPTVISNIERGISEVWERGFCISMGALDPGSNAIGVPYLHPDGRHVLAFNMTAPKTILTRKSIETVWGPKLLNMVREIQGVALPAPASGFHSNASMPRDRTRPSSPMMR